MGDITGVHGKIVACICLCFALSITITFMCFYLSLYNTAYAYNVDNASAGLTYDGCALDST